MTSARLLSSIALLLLALLVTSCYEDNPWYCADRPYNHCGNEPGTFPCRTKDDCSEQAGKQSCTELSAETGFGVCVQCTPVDATACVGATPVCGTDNLCGACGKHADCASAVCLADGSCGSDANVAYVAATGIGAACTKEAPCGTLAAAVAKGKAYVKVAAGTVKEPQVAVIDGKAVTILADDGAKLDRDNDDGAVIRVQGASDVKIFDLEITGASGSGANGVELAASGSPKLALTRVKLTGNQGLGLSISGGSLLLTQSTVSGNLGGGVSITSGTFDITNNFIYRNGSQDTTTLGGLNLGIAVAAGNRLEFNTIVDNRAAINSGGVICNVPTFTGSNNIIARNSLAGSTTVAGAQTTGACTYPTSLVQNDVMGLMLEHPDPPGPFSYKLTTGSSAIDAALTTSVVAVDADGEVRPQGDQKDIGADEYKGN